MKVLFEEIVSAWSNEPLKHVELELSAGGNMRASNTIEDLGGTKEQGFQTLSQRIRKIRKKRFISLLDVMERYQRQGFFTSPGDLIPNFY